MPSFAQLHRWLVYLIKADGFRSNHHRHCEERGDEAIQDCDAALDCFASLAMTMGRLPLNHSRTNLEAPSPFVPAKADTQAFLRALRALGPRFRGDERRRGRDSTRENPALETVASGEANALAPSISVNLTRASAPRTGTCRKTCSD
jgi:hypothetical protein